MEPVHFRQQEVDKTQPTPETSTAPSDASTACMILVHSSFQVHDIQREKKSRKTKPQRILGKQSS
jgi:hypothetical protein